MAILPNNPIKLKNMGRIKKNIAVKGLSGMVGGTLVYRRVEGGEIIVASAPEPTRKKPTLTQQNIRDRFRMANFYATRILKISSRLAQYIALAKSKGLRSPRTAAIADYLNFPEIIEIIFSGYSGQTGDVIVVIATDYLSVETVVITIITSGGTELEKGNATLDSDGQTWRYTATSMNSSLTGTTIAVNATDVPGNVTCKQITL